MQYALSDVHGRCGKYADLTRLPWLPEELNGEIAVTFRDGRSIQA